jgi:hypothetical protein
VPGLKDACRAYCVHVLNCAYRKVPAVVIGESLALSGAELNAFVAGHCANGGWVKEGDVRIPCLLPRVWDLFSFPHPDCLTL